MSGSKTKKIFAVARLTVEILFLFHFFLPQIPARGSLALVVLMTLLQGWCGMAYGLFISALVDNEMSAMQFALGSFYPVLLLSGKYSNSLIQSMVT